MKFEKKTEKHSAAKRLIPAAAMLAASATMLSTATYAWFTMNKEVKLTGLSMTATTGEGIEISLASVTGVGNTLTFVDDPGDKFEVDSGRNATHPKDTDDEKGWKSTVEVGQYYAKIGKIKPASSADGLKYFDANDATENGKKATKFSEITLGNGTMAKLTPQISLAASETKVGPDTSADSSGYYIDIPVHIRTSKTKTTGENPEETGDLYCKMILNNGTAATADETDVLYKAVRVAFIPVTTGTTSTTKIFGVNDDFYGTGAVNGTTTLATSKNVETSFVTNLAAFTDGVGVDSGLKLPYAENAGEYGHLDFILRVWLEGESTSCFDANAGQSWNISLAFSLGEFDVPPSP